MLMFPETEVPSYEKGAINCGGFGSFPYKN